VRIIDVIASGLGLLILSPLFLVLALLVKLTSHGPAFYRAARIGKGGHAFRLYKFRTMISGGDGTGPGITAADDTRITRIGRFLRKTKLDELPQLINVLGGEMSLVGPRPEDPRYVALYTPTQRQVLVVRPGITSAASLAFRDEATLLQGSDWHRAYVERILPQKLAIDLAYLQQRTIWSDLLLIFRTIIAVVTR
jgi:lipopolysaccharide/colanic/teichoic acid biosynthesis glycosyltransferase